MKPLNNAERKAYRRKFIGLYGISVGLIIFVLCAFLQPAPAIKTIMVEKEKPAKVIIKKVYVTQRSIAASNFHEHDSFIAAVSFKQRKIDSLTFCIQMQKDTITKLQNQPETTNKPMVNNISNKDEVVNLKKQIKFFDWALRSQVAVTNTLTKENNNLKDKIAQFGKNK